MTKEEEKYQMWRNKLMNARKKADYSEYVRIKTDEIRNDYDLLKAMKHGINKYNNLNRVEKWDNIRDYLGNCSLNNIFMK